MASSTVLLVPVKDWQRAKSRLASSGAEHTMQLAEAFALDTIAAALRCPAVDAVYVITDQAGFRPQGTTVLPDEGAGDLNAALRAAEARVRAQHPQSAVAVLCADLPALRPDDLAAAITDPGGGEPRRFVADQPGTGTTLLLAGPGTALEPAFGAGSARRHRDSGAAPLGGELRSLRLDVDTLADLETALDLGAGTNTVAVLDLD